MSTFGVTRSAPPDNQYSGNIFSLHPIPEPVILSLVSKQVLLLETFTVTRNLLNGDTGYVPPVLGCPADTI